MLYNALVKRKHRREDGVDIDDSSTIAISPNGNRNYVKKQVQEVQAEIKIIHEWRKELSNRTSPEYMLFVGNLVDALNNEFIADLHYLSSAVSVVRPAETADEVIATIAIRFFKTEDDPLLHLQGIIQKGWISSQKVDYRYFKNLGVINGNNNKPLWHYPEDINLHVIPAFKSPGNNTRVKMTKKKPPAVSYREVQVIIKVKQHYEMFLEQHNSPEFAELSGNIEVAISQIFLHDSLYIEAHVLDFRESEEGRILVTCSLRFQLSEKHSIEKCEAMISSGDLAGIPVDDQYIVIIGSSDHGIQMNMSQLNVSSSPAYTEQNYTMYKHTSLTALLSNVNNNSLYVNDNKADATNVSDVSPQNMHSNAAQPVTQPSQNVYSAFTQQPPAVVPVATQSPVTYKQKPKPLQFREVRISIEMEQPWNDSLSSNVTKLFIVYSATIEQAVNRAFVGDVNYIDASIVDFLEGQYDKTIVNLAVRFHLEEKNPQQKLKAMIQNGTLSGIPVNKEFFYVFSLSETMHPSNDNNGQKQQASDGQFTSEPVLTGSQPIYVTATKPPITYNTNVTFNPYLPIKTNPITQTSKQSFFKQPSLQNTATKYETSPQDQYYVPSVAPATLSTQPVVNSASTPEKTFPEGSESNESTNEIEGFMTLQQSWHPYLSDKTSSVYKGLESAVVAAIKSVYNEANEIVVPTIIGFSEAAVPVSYVNLSTEKKVGVRFKVTFLPGHKALSGPLERAVITSNVGGILIHENSLVLVAAPVKSGAKINKPNLTICQQQQVIAESTSGATVGGFIPQCTPDGQYKTVQCHALTGFCWCNDKDGVRIQGTEERYKEPNCEGLRISGKVYFMSDAPSVLPIGSCLTILVQEMVSCGGNVSCHVPLAGNKTVTNPVVSNKAIYYELDTAKLKPGPYSISAVLNIGWCRTNSYKSQDLIRPGDYHSRAANDIIVNETMTKVVKDIPVELVSQDETGIKLDGKIILPDDTPLTYMPNGSCLSIDTKQLNLCTEHDCPNVPSTANETLTNLNIVNKTIPYSLKLPELDPGTYVISAVLHVGQCPSGDQTMLSGDFYNDAMHDYEVSPSTTEVTKDINVIKLNEEEEGIIVTGRVKLPENKTDLPPGSCMTVSSRKLIQCKNNNCKIPPVATKTFENITTQKGSIPYLLRLPMQSPGKYIISAVINYGWCRDENSNDWIKEGDLYNDKIHDFEMKNETVIGKNIDVVELRSTANIAGITVHGDVILPGNLTLRIPRKSCLTVVAQEFKLCSGVIDCVKPLSAKETFHDFQLQGNHIPYAITLPYSASGDFIISAVLNMGWCREDSLSSPEWIREGDYHNDETNDFMVQENDTQIEKNIEVELFTNPVTGPPTGGYSKQLTNIITKEPSTTSLPVVDIHSSNLYEQPIVDSTADNIPPSSLLSKETSTQPPLVSLDANPTSRSTISNHGPNGTSATPEEEFIPLPEGLPKSCEEIRNSGIGNTDGQYIIEARKGCHLSIICQYMKEKNPREFLGGPSEDEWKYWHFAILVKMTENDKKNIPTGACLENTQNGRDLLRRIQHAGAAQNNPLDKWKTSISSILGRRNKRHIQTDTSVITKARQIFKGERKRNWGVL